MYVCIYVSIYLSTSITIMYQYLSIYLSIYPPNYVSIYLSTSIIISINIYHLSIYLSSFCLYTYPRTYLSSIINIVLYLDVGTFFSSPQPLLRYLFHFHASDQSGKILCSVGLPAWRHRKELSTSSTICIYSPCSPSSAFCLELQSGTNSLHI